MDKILLVGGSGMLGKQISNGLSKDFEIVIFDRNKRTNFETVQFDVFNSNKFKEEFKKYSFKAAIHLVGSKNISHAEKENLDQIKKLNLQSLQNLIDSCAGTETKIIFASSAAIYGKLPVPQSENLNPAPINKYGEIKKDCENLLIKESTQKGINYTILRIWSIYSKDDNKLLIGNMFNALKNREEIRVKNTYQLRDFIHIDDLIETIKRVILSEKSNNQTINVGSGVGHKLSDIVELFERNSSLRIARDPDDPNMGYDSIADTKKMKEITGIRGRDIFDELKSRLIIDGRINESHKNLFENKVICVTGGLGSIGQDIVRGLLKFDPKKIIIADNRETELFYSKSYPMGEKIHNEFVDIRDYNSVEKVLEGVDIIFHTAAMKHVVVCEDAPFEAIKTNVLGTNNVIESCIKNKVKKMILISTDKAVNPASVMGTTKLLAEKLVGAIATSTKLKENSVTEFGIVRFGNVLYSRGSVLEIWNKQLRERREITITDENMTRFFMATSDCVELIFHATELAKEGEIFILKMPSVRMGDLAKAFSEIKGLPKENIKKIGIRKGEKKHEELLLEDDDNITLENEGLFIKFPSYTNEERIKEVKAEGFKESSPTKLSSNNQKLLSVEEIKNTLLKEKRLLEGE